MADAGPVSRERALSWLRPVAEALDVAHAQGVVHRDIKPANLLLDDQDRVAVADFGIASLAHETERFTQTGQVLGTAVLPVPRAGRRRARDVRLGPLRARRRRLRAAHRHQAVHGVAFRGAGPRPHRGLAAPRAGPPPRRPGGARPRPRQEPERPLALGGRVRRGAGRARCTRGPRRSTAHAADTAAGRDTPAAAPQPLARTGCPRRAAGRARRDRAGLVGRRRTHGHGPPGPQSPPRRRRTRPSRRPPPRRPRRSLRRPLRPPPRAGIPRR